MVTAWSWLWASLEGLALDVVLEQASSFDVGLS